MRVELWTKPYIWHKIEVSWGKYWCIIWELGEPHGNMMRTCSEHIGHKEEKKKKTSSTSPPKGKKLGQS
jgi:hypothetical protein